jgi:hypothetical protein
MSEDALPPVPPIEDRRMILALADAAEAIAALALAALASSEQVRTDRMGSARVQLDHAIRQLDLIFGNTLNEPQP